MTTFLDDETLQLYIEESKEHLETIESDLLELEKQGKNFDEELVNKVFRAAHSIKGGGGFLGFTNIKELAHKIENVLHLVRTFQLDPTSALINTLLNAYDRLGELIDHSEQSNDMEIEEYIEKLENAVSNNLPDEEKPTLNKEITIKHPAHDLSFTVKEYDVKQARQGGKQLYILDFDLIRDVHKQKKTPFDVISLLKDSGIIIDINTVVSAAGDLFSDITEPAIPMCVLFASIVEPDLVEIIFNLKSEQINVIIDEAVKAAAAEPEIREVKPVKDVKLEDPIIVETPDKTILTKTETSSVKQKASLKKTDAKPPGTASETLRVNVSVLDQLMNRAGELVLARNQLLQSVFSWDRQSVLAAGQRVDLVTSELQETIMLTRMQHVGTIFNKFPRVVRGLAMDLGKKMELKLEGTEVELDKTIIEGLADPLTHLVRNSADHGIETPQEREKKGKPKTGSILLKAYHESGQVIIEIKDDGKGLNPEKIAEKAVGKGLFSEADIQVMSDKEKLNLIMLPGFSTAEKVTDVSGRGVGMDVVKTNLDKMGGQVELISEVDKGTTIKIKLPLTLAIIPSLLVMSTNERFAIPQVNVAELLRIPAKEVREKIEKIGDADVLILRGELIPVLQLNNVLKLKSTYYDFKTGTIKQDRRSGVADLRLQSDSQSDEKKGVDADERRSRRESDVIVVILSEGTHKYGLIVDAVFDSVEIVVKPLGRHLKESKVYAGATIMGDGHVALILDVRGMAEKAELKAIAEIASRAGQQEDEVHKEGATRQTLLIFHNGPDEVCAVPLDQVLRVEQILASDIEMKGGKKVIQYRGGTLTVYALEEVANVEMLEAGEKLIVLIFKIAGREIGLLAIRPLDVVDQELVLDDKTLRQPGIAGSTIIDGKTTLLVDVHEIVQIINPHWFTENKILHEHRERTAGADTPGKSILLVEDSQFFRNQVKRFIEAEGFTVIEAEDGQKAWEYIGQFPDEISLVITDLEMPIMDGFELTRNLKSDTRFSSIPVVALTSLAADEDIRKGKEVGIDDYQIKLDKENLIESIRKRLQ
ncbi:chemotaxis protein CheW [bacterium]|nr:chemotaxis protein CheW [bacterium]